MKDYKHISTYFKENYLIVIITSISGLCFNGLMCFIPIYLGKVVTSIENNNSEMLKKYLIIFVIFVLFTQINRFLKRYFVRLFAGKMVLRMRTEAYQNLISSDDDTHSKGDLINRVMGDIGDTAEGTRKVLTEIFDSFVLMLGYFVSLVILDYKISIFSILFMILSIVIASLLKKRIVKTIIAYKQKQSETKDYTISLLKNELAFRGIGVTDNYDHENESKQDLFEKHANRSMILQGTLEPIYNSIAIIGLVFVIYFGGKNYYNNNWDIGMITTYLTTFTLLYTKVSRIGKLMNSYQKAKVSWARCKPFLGKSSSVKEKEEILTKQIIINDLSMTYGLCTNKLNLTINNGEIIGICGGVHTGKSLLLSFLAGLNNYEGSINHFGQELRNKNPLSISYLGSDVDIFNLSVKDNILLGREDDYEHLLRLVLLDEEINQKGFDSYLSHSYQNLSGGQKKRLGIARSLVKCPRVLLLDNPFSEVEQEMALKIFLNIIQEKEKKNKEQIIILVTNSDELLQKTNKIIYLKGEYIVNTYDNFIKDPTFNKLVKGKTYEC